MKLLIKEVRKQKNLSLSGLARLSGISKTRLQGIENHKTLFSLTDLELIALALKVPVSDLWMEG